MSIFELGEYVVKQRTGWGNYICLTNKGNLYGKGYAGGVTEGCDCFGLGLTDTSIVDDLTKLPIEDVKDFALGDTRTLVIKNDNTLWVTGDAIWFTFGNNSNTNLNTFTKVDLDIGVMKSVHATHNRYSYIETEDGKFYYAGQLYPDGVSMSECTFSKTFTEFSLLFKDNGRTLSIKDVIPNRYFLYIVETNGNVYLRKYEDNILHLVDTNIEILNRDDDGQLLFYKKNGVLKVFTPYHIVDSSIALTNTGSRTWLKPNDNYELYDIHFGTGAGLDMSINTYNENGYSYCTNSVKQFTSYDVLFSEEINIDDIEYITSRFTWSFCFMKNGDVYMAGTLNPYVKDGVLTQWYKIFTKIEINNVKDISIEGKLGAQTSAYILLKDNKVLSMVQPYSMDGIQVSLITGKNKDLYPSPEALPAIDSIVELLSFKTFENL